ncbi:hypothetical protein V8J88_03280 [Massilia sp. W12]|uniref:hypothetical protein n=1 Tax=Massilia sp. W12 TaxID=3126507 RepID=UPI0030CC4F66
MRAGNIFLWEEPRSAGFFRQSTFFPGAALRVEPACPHCSNARIASDAVLELPSILSSLRSFSANPNTREEKE